MIKIFIFLVAFTYSIFQTPQCMASDQSKNIDFDLLLENYRRLNGDPIAFFQAMCFFRIYENSLFFAKGDPSHPNGLKIRNKNFIAITDLNKSSSTARLFVLNLKTSEVRAYFIAHGVGTPGGKVELFPIHRLTDEQIQRLLFPTKLSNEPGSNATPHGVFILGDTYFGSFGYSLKIHGLQAKINDNTFSRHVVMHGFKGMNSTVISSSNPAPERSLSETGNLALSQGCSMMESNRAKEVINDLKGNSLYYVYSAAEKNESESYCADRNLLQMD
jgi:hypothetical protein